MTAVAMGIYDIITSLTVQSYIELVTFFFAVAQNPNCGQTVEVPTTVSHTAGVLGMTDLLSTQHTSNTHPSQLVLQTVTHNTVPTLFDDL